MKTLNSALILAKNQLYNVAPWVVLFELDIDGTDSWRLAIYPDDITWNGETWERFPAIFDSILDRTTQRTSTVVQIRSLLDQELLGGIGQF